MNLQIVTYLDYEGFIGDLDPLINDIGSAVLRHGFGNEDGEQENLRSLVVLSETDIKNFGDAQLFLQQAVADHIVVVIPIKEETDGSSDD